MDNYIVSARKYRPMTFSSVVGQEALTTTLKNAVKSGKLAHAYLFCGPRGVGMTTCARIFAKAISNAMPWEKVWRLFSMSQSHMPLPLPSSASRSCWVL